MTSCRLLLAKTTCVDSAAAERLARALVQARLAACVSIGAPVRSVYPWHERIEMEEEIPLTIKTAPARVAALKRFIAEHHDYDVPELLISPVTDGAEAYLQWAEQWMNND
ncbi:MAG: divalent-cation tolerance protein CutA [Wenzhouxiangella sp.]|jgi:periplasmic divalent cation tolerance protein|nr:divalent-cation tolerance protein CutA [Wenzhouxiangella sp.]